MSDSPGTEGALQFDRAEFSGPATTVCASCSQPIVDEFYEANGSVFCTGCRQAIVASFTGGSGSRRFFRAALFGSGAGLLGALIYFGVVRITGWNIGLIAIVVGFLVGAAVRKGSDDRGGVGYQVLALVLTYLSIGLSLAPDIYSSLGAESDGALRVIVTVITSIMGPVLVAMDAPISGIIYAFALYEAFRRNKKAELALTGPYPVQRAEDALAEAPPTPGVAVG